MTLRRVIFFYKIALLVFFARLRRIQLLPTCFHRTRDEQKELYAIGRTKELDRKPVTNCDGVTKISKHQIWEAIDFCIYKDGKLIWQRGSEYEILGKIAKILKLRWGGDWNADDKVDPGDFDIYHFELGE